MHRLSQIDPCTSGWTRNTGGELLRFNGQQFLGEIMKPATQKTPKRQNPICNKQTPPLPLPLPAPSSQALRPQRFSALFPKYSLRDGTESNSDCFAGNEGHESDTDTSDRNSDSGDSDHEVYT